MLTTRSLFAGLVLAILLSCQQATVIENNQWSLSDAHFNELLEMCNVNTLKTYDEFGVRLERIQDIFASNNDPRGAFPTVYKAITDAALASVLVDDYDDAAFIEQFGLDFSKSYLHFLEQHLLNQPLEYHWELYYRHCKEKANITRLVVEGINGHLTIDLTRSLATIGIVRDNLDDWILVGDKTVLSVPGFLEELQSEYNTDAYELFHVYFIGDIIDEIFGDGTAVNFGFNLLRLDAFENAIKLQQPEKAEQIEKNMRKAFYERENIIALLDEMNLTP